MGPIDRNSAILLLSAAAGGVAIGLACFTFAYAGGHAYLVNDPHACMNCHAMQQAFDSWTAGAHRSIACYDCHLPTGFPERWTAKVESGFRHAWAFTFADVQVIEPVESTRRIVEANCIRCHESMVGHLALSGGFRCFDCHAETRHSR
jgi:cytochrome c nitrite reductase small subunit